MEEAGSLLIEDRRRVVVAGRRWKQDRWYSKTCEMMFRKIGYKKNTFTLYREDDE